MKKGKEKVTVVIPNYNGIKFLRECLDSLRNQVPDTPAYQVLVVDNGSGDGSLELIASGYPEVQVIPLASNTGFCHAVNVGIRASKTPYVILLNNDTKADACFVKSLYEAVTARPKAFSVSARMLMWDDQNLIDDAGDQYCVLGWAYARGKGKPAAQYGEPAEVFSACGGAAIYRKRILEEIGLFDEAHFAYLEDVDIGFRARIHGYRNYYEPSARVVHYGSASSGSRYNAWKTSLAAANSVYVIAKNMPPLQILWNLPFLLAGFFLKFLFFCRKGMGILYLKGLRDGLKKSASRNLQNCRKLADMRRKTPGSRILCRYLALQWQLYLNTFRFLKKS